MCVFIRKMRGSTRDRQYVFLLSDLNALYSAGNGPDNCCFKFYPRRIRAGLVESYYMIDHRCPKPAVIFVIKKGRSLCMDPSLSWVDSIMKTLDESTF
uniref:Chemokine interleukin-8-like domain-containing protein n=1 Tax=Astatotilapia calliptera TaxID=8154 RepID=A0AAX7SXP4_ASTCA